MRWEYIEIISTHHQLEPWKIRALSSYYKYNTRCGFKNSQLEGSCVIVYSFGDMPMRMVFSCKKANKAIILQQSPIIFIALA
jgi:hypothetical protein